MVCTVYTITFLKLWSYAHVNFWCRRAGGQTKIRQRRRAFSVTQPCTSFNFNLENENNLTLNFIDSFEVANGKASSVVNEVVSYPNNLSVRDLYFFMAVPSLCYELNFPRTSRIRKRFLLKRVVEVFLGMQVVLGLFQQWIIPSVKNSLDTFSVRVIVVNC